MKRILNLTSIILLLGAISCQVGSNESSYGNQGVLEDTLAVAVANEEYIDNQINQIKVPISFDPRTPVTDNLKNANLHDMVVKKYYSFENPKNRRKHKPVLHRRVNSDGVIDLTAGGPLSYEEMWEMGERQGHSLSSYFYDAAYIDKWSGGMSSLSPDPEFKYVNETSNLAKVYFIDDFSGFVRYNKSYCDNIINMIEQEASNAHLQEVQERQKLYE